ncbi:ABC transporter permease [uncultured Paludibaculum sp.]|uniref:ABC transporter permease n=1 Tax=uncultured Paludibaculum sp. TaxID=1765020 RepID=UPI002AAC1665|nr:ABC transporter permease [uncultured Paludibaculum sp.]
MLADLRIAARGLRRSPAFTLAAILTLALGIGANSTMFSVVNSVLLRPLSGFETDRLAQICDTSRGSCGFLPPEIYLRLRSRLRSFAPLAASQICPMNRTGQGESEQLTGPCATANWFELQRAQALLGRTFLPDEDQHGRNRVVVLDHGYWQRRFGSDPKVVGRTLTLDHAPWLIVGIMPPGFTPIGAAPAPIYTPYVVADNPHGLNVTGRLKPGVSLEAAQSELSILTTQLARENSEWKTLQFRTSPVLEQVTGQQRPLLLLLLGAVSFVMLIACVNVANLLLARSTARQHEIDIRIALGAGRLHIIRLVLAEALTISFLASLAAIAIAYAGLRLLKPLTATLPRAEELSIDARVLLCTLLLGILAAALFGVLPTLRSVRPGPVAGMRSRTPARGQGTLVAWEVALAFVLLLGAGLLIRTFVTVRSANLGYNPRNVLTTFLTLPPAPDGARAAGVSVYTRIRERITALPGVRAVATASSLPMFGVGLSMDVHPEGQPDRRQQHVASITVVGGAYFRAMEIPLLTGRLFQPEDRDGATPVAIVSESIATRYFSGKATGRRIILPELKFNIDGGADHAAEIIGVVGNVCVNSVEDCQSEHIYLPEPQNALRMANLIVRTEGEPLSLTNVLRHAVYQEAPTVPLDDPQTLEQRTAYLTDAPRRAMWLLGIFAGLALLLAAMGIYGVSSYLAAQRSHEMGIRLALGARHQDIAALIYRGVLVPSILGLTIGAVAALGLIRLLKSQIAEVNTGDHVTPLLAALALLGTATLAATGPALRAALSDPARVLRRD